MGKPIKYSPGALDTREKLVRALRRIPGVEIEKGGGNRHHIMVLYQGRQVPILESGRGRNPSYYVQKIFKELGLENYLL